MIGRSLIDRGEQFCARFVLSPEQIIQMVNISDIQIPCEKDVSYLGIIFDKTINWKPFTIEGLLHINCQSSQKYFCCCTFISNHSTKSLFKL